MRPPFRVSFDGLIWLPIGVRAVARIDVVALDELAIVAEAVRIREGEQLRRSLVTLLRAR